VILDSAEGPIENPQNFSQAAERQSSDWDVRNAPKNYIWLVVLQVGCVILAFATIWLLTRQFGSEGYGGIVAIIAASQIAQVCVNWTSFSLVPFGADEFVETQKIVRIFWTRSIILAINIALALLVARLWYPYIATSFNFPPGTYWLVFGHFVSLALWTHVQLSLQGTKMPRVQGFLLMFERIVIVAAILFLHSGNELNISSAILCYIVGSVSATIAGFYWLRSYIWARFTVDLDFFKKVLIFSLPLLPFTLIGYFSGNQLDYVFISRFLSTRDLGVYSIAAQMIGMLLVVPTVASSLLIPLFVTLEKENQTHKLERFFKDVLPSMSVVWCAGCCLAGFAGYLVIPFVFGVEFAGAVLPWWVLTAGAAATFPVLVGYYALSQATSATYISMFAAIFSAGTNILFNFLLIPVFGLIGSAWATVIAHLISVACFGILIKRARSIGLSWTPLSMLPAVLAAFVLTMTANPYWSLLAAAVPIVLLSFFHRSSLNLAFSFLRNSLEK
jgi:O-antigen/teichoic acid export membrane protein